MGQQNYELSSDLLTRARAAVFVEDLLASADAHRREAAEAEERWAGEIAQRSLRAALLRAVADGAYGRVQELIDRGAALNPPLSEVSALEISVARGDLRMTRLLTRHGADPDRVAWLQDRASPCSLSCLLHLYRKAGWRARLKLQRTAWRRMRRAFASKLH